MYLKAVAEVGGFQFTLEVQKFVTGSVGSKEDTLNSIVILIQQ